MDLSPRASAYLSVGRTEREPARSDMLYGADNAPTLPDLSAVKPESVWDFELGAEWRTKALLLKVNLYDMEFRDEIAATGELSPIGQPLRRNVDGASAAGSSSRPRGRRSRPCGSPRPPTRAGTGSRAGRSSTTSTTRTATSPARRAARSRTSSPSRRRLPRDGRRRDDGDPGPHDRRDGALRRGLVARQHEHARPRGSADVRSSTRRSSSTSRAGSRRGSRASSCR